MTAPEAPLERAAIAPFSAACAVLMLIVCVALPLRSASALQHDICTRFSAVAAATGMRADAASPGYLLVEQADAASAAAQAFVDSATSMGFAGYPYAGEAVLSGLLLTPAGGAFPTAVSSSHPGQPKSSVDAGAYRLSSASDDRTTAAVAEASGNDSPDSSTGVTTAEANAGCDAGGTVSAKSRGVSEGASFGGGLLRIGRVESFVDVVLQPGRDPLVETGIAAEMVTVAGQAARITEDGLEVGGTNPAQPDAWNKALEDNGIFVRFVPASRDVEGAGAVSAGIEVRVERQVVGTGETVVTYTFGRSYAAASFTQPTSGPSTGVSVEPSAGAMPGASGDASGLDQVGSATGGGVAEPSAKNASSDSGLDDRRTHSGRGAPVALISELTASVGIAWYLALVVAAAMVGLGGLLIHGLGVKRSWA